MYEKRLNCDDYFNYDDFMKITKSLYKYSNNKVVNKSIKTKVTKNKSIKDEDLMLLLIKK